MDVWLMQFFSGCAKPAGGQNPHQRDAAATLANDKLEVPRSRVWLKRHLSACFVVEWIKVALVEEV